MSQIRNEQFHEPFIQSARPHVLMITNHGIHQWTVDPGLPDTGGQNVYVNHMTKSMAKQGFKITIVNRGGYPHPLSGQDRRGLDYLDENQRILFIEDGRKEFVRKEDMAAQIPELARFLKDFLQKEKTRVDLTVSHYWDAAKLGAEIVELLPETVKHVWIPHSLGSLKKENMDPSTWKDLNIDERIATEKSLIPELDGVAATSASIRDVLARDYGVRTSLFLPPCIDPERFYPMRVADDDPLWATLSEQSGLPADEIRRRKIVTEMSRTDRTKRKDVLVRAFARVHEKEPDTFLILSLDPNKKDLHEEIMGMVNDLGMADSVAPLGSVWDILPKIYAVTYVYCTPSIMEGFGMAIQEAAATRVPAVSSNLVPFAVEYLLGREAETVRWQPGSSYRHGQGGIVVPANDVEGFAAALEKIVADDLLREEMAEKAYSITIPYFTWDHMINEFIKAIGFAYPRGPLFTRHALTRRKLQDILRRRNVEELSLDEITALIAKEPGISEFKPESICQVDPRTGDRIIYNSARARRPHDNIEEEELVWEEDHPNKTPSIISQGKTTGVIDVSDLSEGFTFINFNLFPMLYPEGGFKGDYGFRDGRMLDRVLETEPIPTAGFHFLQWTSSFQDMDFHNMPVEDGMIVMRAMGRLERTLLEEAAETGGAPEESKPGRSGGGAGDGQRGYVSIIKNCGRLVGGSIAHGHQQIAFSNVMPRRNADLVRFHETHGKLFSEHMLEVTPENLKLRDYGRAILVVPYFMKRPYEMMLLLKDASKSHMYELDEEELRAVTQGWKDGINLMLRALRGLERSIAYNIVGNAGPGAGLSFDFMPYTQEMGGFEHLGLFVCQASTQGCADYLKSVLEAEEG